MFVKRTYGFSLVAFLLFVMMCLISHQNITYGQTPSPSPSPSATPIPSTGAIVGNVVDAETLTGIAGAFVSTDTGDFSTTTGDDGSYFLEVPEGTYLITAAAPNYTSSSQPAVVTAGVPTQVVFFLQSESTSTGVPVYGFVVDADENDLMGVVVTIEGEGYSNSTETDEYGWFEFENVPVGEYTVTFEMDGYQTVVRNVLVLPGEEEVDLDMIIMEAGASISVSVIDARGNPIGNARVRMRGLRKGFLSTEFTDEDGFFEFTDLEADTYLIIVKQKGYRRAKQKVKLKNAEQIEVEIILKKIQVVR